MFAGAGFYNNAVRESAQRAEELVRLPVERGPHRARAGHAGQLPGARRLQERQPHAAAARRLLRRHGLPDRPRRAACSTSSTARRSRSTTSPPPRRRRRGRRAAVRRRARRLGPRDGHGGRQRRRRARRDPRRHRPGRAARGRIGELRRGVTRARRATAARRARSACAKPCPDLSRETVRASSLQVGRRSLVVRVVDVGGNALDRGPYTVDVVTPSNRGAANGTNAKEPGRIVLRFSATKKKRRTVSYGKKAGIRGRLLNADGEPIGGATLRLITRDLRQGARSIDRKAIKTRSDGSFRLTVRARASRQLQIAWRAAPERRPLRRQRLPDAARPRRRQPAARPRSIGVGRRLTLRGRLKGVRRGGVPIVLQGKARGTRKWMTFADTTSEPPRHVQGRLPLPDRRRPRADVPVPRPDPPRAGLPVRDGPHAHRAGASCARQLGSRTNEGSEEENRVSYFVTGATGFIGRHLVERLLQRDGDVYVLVREESREKLDALIERWGARRPGQAGGRRPLRADARRLRGGPQGAGGRRPLLPPRRDLRHDRGRDAATRCSTSAARRTPSSSPTTSARASSTTSPRSPSPAATRATSPRTCSTRARSCTRPTTGPSSRPRRSSGRRSRAPGASTAPSIVVGNSKTGEMDKIDGPYYFFKVLQKLRTALPQWAPLVSIEWGWTNLVPVDYVAAAIDHIAPRGGPRRRRPSTSSTRRGSAPATRSTPSRAPGTRRTRSCAWTRSSRACSPRAS